MLWKVRENGRGGCPTGSLPLLILWDVPMATQTSLHEAIPLTEPPSCGHIGISHGRCVSHWGGCCLKVGEACPRMALGWHHTCLDLMAREAKRADGCEGQETYTSPCSLTMTTRNPPSASHLLPKLHSLQSSPECCGVTNILSSTPSQAPFLKGISLSITADDVEKSYYNIFGFSNPHFTEYKLIFLIVDLIRTCLSWYHLLIQ